MLCTLITGLPLFLKILEKSGNLNMVRENAKSWRICVARENFVVTTFVVCLSTILWCHSINTIIISYFIFRFINVYK